MFFQKKLSLLFFLFVTTISVIAEPDKANGWSMTSTFSMPESAVIDPATGYIYVTNVNEYAKDGNGFVSKVSPDGTNIDLHWLTGLDSPTGISVSDGRLFFADYDVLVEADIATASVINRYPTSDERPVLNDVAIDGDGSVFVSGSASRTIYRLEKDHLNVWLHDPERLKHANGLFIEGNTVIHGGSLLSRFSLDTRKLIDTTGTADLIEIDGISDDGCGGFFFSLIDDRKLWHWSPGGIAHPASDAPLDAIDISRWGNKLVFPQVGDGLMQIVLNDDCSLPAPPM